MTRFRRFKHRWRRWWLVPAVYPHQLDARTRRDIGLPDVLPARNPGAIL